MFEEEEWEEGVKKIKGVEGRRGGAHDKDIAQVLDTHCSADATPRIRCVTK